MDIYLGVSNKTGLGCLYMAENAEIVERSCGDGFAVSDDSFSVNVIDGNGVAKKLYDSVSHFTASRNLLAAARAVALEELRIALRKGFPVDEIPEVEFKRGVVVACAGDEPNRFVATGVSLQDDSVVFVRGHWVSSDDEHDIEIGAYQVVSESIPILTAAVENWMEE